MAKINPAMSLMFKLIPHRPKSRGLWKIGLILAAVAGLFPIGSKVFAVAGLKGEGSDASANGFPGRVIAFQPGINTPTYQDIRDIFVEAIYLSRGAPSAGRAEILNFGYLVTVNGITLFHTGDIDASDIDFEAFRSLRWPENNIDLAFLQHFYLSDIPAECKLIREGIAARVIIPTHYQYTDPPLNPEAVLRNYPEAVLFKAELQSWAMPHGKR
jgi:L-ascorbate metabolism protein UlaG (beta-lactamase superfamily)